MAVLRRPVDLRSWNSLVRLGLIHIISADSPVSHASVPETLLLDLERLFRLQNEFGRIIVLAACLLVLQQSSISQGKWHLPFAALRLPLLCGLSSMLTQNTQVALRECCFLGWICQDKSTAQARHTFVFKRTIKSSTIVTCLFRSSARTSRNCKTADLSSAGRPIDPLTWFSGCACGAGWWRYL